MRSISNRLLAPPAAGAWMSYGPFGNYVHSLAIDPVMPTIIYAGTAGRGVFKSTDGGANWTRATTGMGNVLTSLGHNIDGASRKTKALSRSWTSTGLSFFTGYSLAAGKFHLGSKPVLFVKPRLMF